MRKTREERKEYKKGLWTVEEDKILMDYVRVHGKGQWNRVAKKTGLKRCGKSCRLRWMNYLSPDVKKGHFTEQEEDLIIRLHKLLGNRWSLIAKRVPGRTDNQVKNYWNTHLSKKIGIKDQTPKMGQSIVTDSPQKNKEIISSSSADESKQNNINENETHSNDEEDVRAIDERNDCNSKGFWIHEEDFELSSLTFLGFVDGYCF